MTKKNGVICKKKNGKKKMELTGGSFWGFIKDWVVSIIHELGDIGRAIGNFVNNNMDLFTTILIDLVVCLVFPEFGILDFAGSIIAISMTIAKYSSPDPNNPVVSSDDALEALNSLMSDDRWDTGFTQPVRDYMAYILNYTLSTPAPVRSDTGQNFDLHGLIREVEGGFVVYSLDLDIDLSKTINFKPDVNNWKMTITGANGNSWTNGGSREQAIATLTALDNLPSQLLLN
jgi:hypothetical protein